MSDQYKSSEVIFKYYLPDNQDELWIHIQASDMYDLIYQIDQLCRSFVKYGSKDILNAEQLAEKIREMICENIDLDKIS